MYVFHLLINKSVFTVCQYLYNERMFDRCNFLMFQCKYGRAGASKEAGDEAEEGDEVESERERERQARQLMWADRERSV